MSIDSDELQADFPSILEEADRLDGLGEDARVIRSRVERSLEAIPPMVPSPLGLTEHVTTFRVNMTRFIGDIGESHGEAMAIRAWVGQLTGEEDFNSMLVGQLPDFFSFVGGPPWFGDSDAENTLQTDSFDGKVTVSFEGAKAAITARADIDELANGDYRVTVHHGEELGVGGDDPDADVAGVLGLDMSRTYVVHSKSDVWLVLYLDSLPQLSAGGVAETAIEPWRAGEYPQVIAIKHILGNAANPIATTRTGSASLEGSLSDPTGANETEADGSINMTHATWVNGDYSSTYQLTGDLASRTNLGVEGAPSVATSGSTIGSLEIKYNKQHQLISVTRREIVAGGVGASVGVGGGTSGQGAVTAQTAAETAGSQTSAEDGDVDESAEAPGARLTSTVGLSHIVQTEINLDAAPALRAEYQRLASAGDLGDLSSRLNYDLGQHIAVQTATDITVHSTTVDLDASDAGFGVDVTGTQAATNGPAVTTLVKD